jgi:hypothetical protein
MSPFPEAVMAPAEAGDSPKVLTEDVRAILLQVIREDDDTGAVSTLAEKARTSPRTVYRVLSHKHAEAISLDLADRLCIAAGSHVALCRLRWPDGSVTSYF